MSATFCHIDNESNVDGDNDDDDDDDDDRNILGTHLCEHVADIFHLISTQTLINTCA